MFTRLTSVKGVLQELVDDVTGLNITLTIKGGVVNPEVSLAIGKLALCVVHILGVVLSIVRPLLLSVNATVQGLVCDIM